MNNVENVSFGIKTGAIAEFESELESVVLKYMEHMTLAELIGTMECVKYKAINSVD